ncbi:MAG: ATP-binding cassette domain-containing protein [Acidimicrobiaceae bacterium]|nr:ATP-binding cassette domain-containing protein [Acidimicrobiaceae bacterium]MYH93303.1 ATP-binding cassette domain-containing protein [Acidimicrobiaceae bacterium]
MTSEGTPVPHAGRDGAVLSLRGVQRTIDGARLLRDVDWEVRPGQRWVVLGPNGSGKTTLVRIATMWDHPSAGAVELLGERLGRTDVRRLRARVGFTSAAMAAMLRPSLTAAEVVITAKHAALAPWWHAYDADDAGRAQAALERVGCGDRIDQRFGTLSSGEQQRVLLARALSMEPGVIVLDEPNAGLDLAGREQLIVTLSGLAADPETPPLVLVTHHTDEIPDGFTHALLLRDGAVLAAGPLDETLTSRNLSECFGLELTLERRHGRWTARAARSSCS